MAPPQVEIAKNLRPPRRVHCLKLLARDEAGDNGAKFEEERFSLFFGEREGERERERERGRERGTGEREMIEGGGETAPRKYWLLKITLPPRRIYGVPPSGPGRSGVIVHYTHTHTTRNFVGARNLL